MATTGLLKSDTGYPIVIKIPTFLDLKSGVSIVLNVTLISSLFASRSSVSSRFNFAIFCKSVSFSRLGLFKILFQGPKAVSSAALSSFSTAVVSVGGSVSLDSKKDRN